MGNARVIIVITFSHKGDFGKTESLFQDILKYNYKKVLKNVGEAGVAALAEATPKRTGKTAASWSYEVKKTNQGYRIDWTNTNMSNGISVAMLIFYGHGTSTGYYVEGIDYINPALKPIFEKLGHDAWEVTIKNA